MPDSPAIVGAVDTPHRAYDVAVADNYAYVADYISGLQIAWRQCDDVSAVADEEIPSTSLRLAAHPNPFNPQTTISFSLERTEWAEIGVYDLGGRLLSVLADRIYDAGHHTIVWYGKDAMGRALPSGSYVVRLETESNVEARKVSLIR